MSGRQTAPAGRVAAAGQSAPVGPMAPVGVGSQILRRIFCCLRELLVGGVESVGQVRRCLEGEDVFVVILVCSWREGVLAVVEHVSGVVCGEVAGLGPKVQENGIGFPAAQGTDGGLVHSGDEESSGSAGA